MTTYYSRQLHSIKRDCFANQRQLDKVIAARHYINRNFAEQLTLDRLAQIRFLSKFHLLRLFKKYYGQTPKQYLTEKRLEKARELLGQGLSVTATCFDVGFDCPGSFSTLFKARVGLTPTEFQKEQLSQSHT